MTHGVNHPSTSVPSLDLFELDPPSGSAADAARAQFDRDVAWLQSCGVACARHGFERDRGAFDENDLVRSLIDAQGEAALPLVLADGTIVGAGAYPTRPELARAIGLGSGGGTDDYTARLLAAGVTLGATLARHDPAWIEAAFAQLKALGAGRSAVAQTIDLLRTTASPLLADAEVAEALDRLAARGTLQTPGGSCCRR